MRQSLSQFAATRKYFWRKLRREGLNLLFPPVCPLCHEAAPEAHALCAACFSNLHFISHPACDCCGQPFPYAMGEGALCASCLDEQPLYDKAWSVFAYDDQSRHLVTRLKFNDRTDLVPLLGRLLHGYGTAVTKGREIVMPVPLHRKRLLQRRYNQSLYLAREVSKRCAIPLMIDGLRRQRHTAPQTGLSRKERLVNVARAFGVAPRYADTIKGRHVLLVDDVFTTGATINACARALKKAGAASIHVLTVARRFPE